MTPARFGLQSLLVLMLLVCVSWPEQGLRAGGVWRADGPLADRHWRANSHRPEQPRGRARYGFGSASFTGSSGHAPEALRRLYRNDVEGRRRRPTPAAVLALGGRVNALVGWATTALNSPIPHARLLLRNIFTGRIEAHATSDEAGWFVFLDLYPSGYIVELVGPEDTVIATSEIVAMEAGDLRETAIRRAAPGALTAAFGGVFGPTVSEPIAAATRDGVTQVVPSERCVSPPCSSR